MGPPKYLLVRVLYTSTAHCWLSTQLAKCSLMLSILAEESQGVLFSFLGNCVGMTCVSENIDLHLNQFVGIANVLLEKIESFFQDFSRYDFYSFVLYLSESIDIKRVLACTGFLGISSSTHPHVSFF